MDVGKGLYFCRIVVALFAWVFFGCVVHRTHGLHRSTTQLDLSYLHRVKADTLLQAIRDTLGHDKDVEIDVSSSLFGKSIMGQVVSSLKGSGTATIQFLTRNNQLSPADATMFLEAIIGSEEETVNITTQISDDQDSNTTTPALDDHNATVDTANRTSSDESFPSVSSIDFGGNDFGQDLFGSKQLFSALKKLVANPIKCPDIIRFDICSLGPAACRSLGKGIIDRYKKKGKSESIKPISLHLSRNENIGDAGVAALSAAIRIVNQDNDALIFDVLDLSGCGIGDAGADALAIAIESRPGCIKHLDLSNNHISDDGAAAIGRALCSKTKRRGIDTVDLSNNSELGDSGARILAQAIQEGMIQDLLVRSCNIHAEGASAIAKALRALRALGDRKHEVSPPRRIDLSGNPLGILRKKSKSGGGKYSATALKSKASATTAAYMNLIGSTVQKGLKDFGIAAPDPAESDDVEDAKANINDDEDDPSKAKCGALAFASSFIDDGNQDSDASSGSSASRISIEVAMRRCFLDSRAADALAAVIQEASEHFAMDLTVDVTMNDVLEDTMVDALRGSQPEHLSEMAERYLEAMEIIRTAKEQALQAAEAAAARIKAEARLEAAWGAPADIGNIPDEDYENEWDSDADYENEEGEYDYGGEDI